jgi:hypothetical protein
MKSSFQFDGKTVEKIVPNFNGTYTVFLTDGTSITLNCAGPEEFQVFEDAVKETKKYKDLKAEKNK